MLHKIWITIQDAILGIDKPEDIGKLAQRAINVLDDSVSARVDDNSFAMGAIDELDSNGPTPTGPSSWSGRARTAARRRPPSAHNR